MSETYVECLVSAKKSVASKVIVVLLIILTVLFVLAMLLIPPAMLLAAATGIGAYFVNLYSDVEYEYLYLDKEISVDRIMAQSRRKRMADYGLERMEVFAPIGSRHLDNFRKRDVKEIDYSTGKEEEPDGRYVMYYEGGVKVIFSPSEKFVNALYNAAPRKVFKD